MRVICLPLTRVRLVLYKVKFCGCIDQRKCLSSIVFLPNTYSTVILKFLKKCKKIREITFHKNQKPAKWWKTVKKALIYNMQYNYPKYICMFTSKAFLTYFHHSLDLFGEKWFHDFFCTFFGEFLNRHNCVFYSLFCIILNRTPMATNLDKLSRTSPRIIN